MALRRLAAGSTLLALAVAIAACERGCLWGFISDRAGPVSAGRDGGGAAALGLNDVDCPDGLARCQGGQVQASRAYHYAFPCVGSPERCACPWEPVGECACAADGVEIVAPRELARAQLCAPRPGSEIARPFTGEANDAEAALPCDGEAERFRCVSGIVHVCSAANLRPAMVCARGCSGIEGLPADAEVTLHAAAAILCRR